MLQILDNFNYTILELAVSFVYFLITLSSLEMEDT